MIRLLALALVVLAAPAAAQTPQRIVSIGGDVTEIVYALGAGDRLVGVDSTSQWPPQAEALPDVGYARQLAPEGVLSLRPDLVLAGDSAGPATVLAVIDRAAPIARIPPGDSFTGVAAKIRAVAGYIGETEKGAALATRFEADAAAAAADVARLAPGPRVLPLLSASGGRILACGRGSAADAMIRLAGAINVAADVEGCKPFSPEAAAAARPDVILAPSHAAEGLGGVEGLRRLPQIAITPAGRSGRIVTMDSLELLGFGLRTPETVRTLARRLREPSA